MPCCGFLRKKRSKSVPPGGTQVKDDNKNKKSQPQAVNQSQPNLTEQQNRRQVVEQEQATNNSHLRDILVNARNHDKQFEDESMQIYPVPPQFQSPRASQYSSHNPEEEYDYEEDDDESEEDEDTKPPTKRSQENEDFLNELNKDLQDELKLRLAVPPKKPERTIADDLGESGLDSSGNVTIRNAGQNQNQNQDEFIRPPRPSTEAANNERSVNNNTVNVIRSQSNLNQTNVTSRDFDLSNVNEMSITSLQKLVETVNMEKNTVDTVREENRNLKSLIEDLKSEMLSREAKYKEENDALMSKVHQTLTKEAKSDTERDELMKLLSAKQQHANESLIQEQARLIESLRTRCDQYEKALSIRTGSIELQVKEYKDEITTLRAIVHRLSAELSSFQCKYPHESPSLQASLKKFELSPLPGTGPTPIWLINTKFLSPLIAAYDDRLIEKDEKLRLFKKKLNELTEKFEMILNENKELNSKLEKAYQLGRVNDTEGFNEINSIRNQAILVLEENKSLQEQVDLLRSKLGDAQKNSIIEINNLSKKIIVLDSEKLDLRNQLERIKLNYDDLTRRYNDLSTEAQSRVRLQEHLSQTGELKRKIDELDVYHKFELEQTGSKISTLEGEKKDLMIRNASLASENKRLLAENKVLDKALNDGIGRKTQRKIQQLEKQVETAELKERTAQSISKTLEKEIEKLTTERETLVNALKEAEIEIKKHHNRLAEESLKFVKLETKLEDFKDKSAQKLATVNEKLKKKDSEFGLVKLESDKRIADILNLLHKKQNEIDDLIKEKRQMEGELEMVWQSTLNENRNMRNAFLDVNRKIDGKIFTSSDYRLLLDD